MGVLSYQSNIRFVDFAYNSIPQDIKTTKYYTFGGSRVAMRQGSTLYYLHSDHLGSTSLTTDTSGNLVSQSRYLPYGQLRWEAPTSGATPTDFGFTGQRNEASFGLMDYNARYYSPVLGRFISPDTVVPKPGNPQSLNRYSYAYNNPVKYTDPSGHCAEPVTFVVCMAIIGGGFALSVDYGVQVTENMQTGQSFWEAGYYENVNTQELGGWTLGGTVAGGGVGAAYLYASQVIAGASTYCAAKGNCAEQGAKAVDGAQQAADNLLSNGTDTVELFRAVGQSEFQDVLQFGDYGLSPSGGGKYFGLTQQGVTDFANSGFNAGQNMAITKINIPQAFIDEAVKSGNAFYFNDPGGAGQSLHFSEEILPELYKIMELPEIINAPGVPIVD